MAEYSVTVRESVAKDLKGIPKKDTQRIIAAIRALAKEPRPPQSRKLSGDEKYRLRCGMYRILYQIEDERLVICVVRVRHRKDVYKT
ncbi:MAG: type II toxin-antitoxin system RelE/ParE family toxin [Patescibacteria group bacterium]|nr:type II toxin-antitoxin system RelE/ParE family toxin [Patescibacteria group bacterium]